jgi:hypothetical protein
MSDVPEAVVEEVLGKKRKGKKAEAPAAKPSPAKDPAVTGEKEEEAFVVGMTVRTARIGIIGTSSLLMHAWSKKNADELENRDKKKPKDKYVKRNPIAEFEAATYRDVDGSFLFPSNAFKKAMVRAAKSTTMAMTDARGAFHVLGTYVIIDGERKFRKDICRLDNGSPQVRYRPEFQQWKALLTIKYDPAEVSIHQLVDLVQRAGFKVGVGEWRPEKGGSNGMFQVVDFIEKVPPEDEDKLVGYSLKPYNAWMEGADKPLNEAELGKELEVEEAKVEKSEEVEESEEEKE